MRRNTANARRHFKRASKGEDFFAIFIGKCNGQVMRIVAVRDFPRNNHRQAHSRVLKGKRIRIDVTKYTKYMNLAVGMIDGRVVRGNHHWNAHVFIPFSRKNSTQSIPHQKQGGGAHSPALQRSYKLMLYRQLATSLSKRAKASRTVAVN